MANIYDFEDVERDESLDNLSGIMQDLWLAPVAWFDTIQEPAVLVGGGYDVDITAAHTFKTGKGFIKLQCTYDTGKLSGKYSEQVDKTGGKIELEAFVPTISKNVLRFFRNAQNTRWIVLAQDTNRDPISGQRSYYQLGAKHLPAFITGDFNTNTTTGDRKGTTMKIESYAAGLEMYSAVVTLKP